MTGTNIAFLTAFLNSSLFKYCYRDNFPELLGGTRELSKVFFDKINIHTVDENINQKFDCLVRDIQKEYTVEKHKSIDRLIFELYELTEQEQKAIGFLEIS